MPEFDYAGIRDTVVQPLMADFGKQTDGILKIPGTPTGPAYNPTPGEDTEQAVKVVEKEFTERDIPSSTVQITDTLFLMSPEGVTVEPALGHRLEVEGETYQVVWVKRLRPGSVTMLYYVFARN